VQERIHGISRVVANDGGPRPHIPTVDESRANIRIGGSKTLGHVRGIAPKEKCGAIYRVSVGSAEHELATCVRVPRPGEVLVAELRTTLKIVRHELVNSK
jgi:hypothetical protein